MGRPLLDLDFGAVMGEGESDRHADLGGEQVQLVTAVYVAVWSREAEAIAVQFVGGDNSLHILCTREGVARITAPPRTKNASGDRR